MSKFIPSKVENVRPIGIFDKDGVRLDSGLFIPLSDIVKFVPAHVIEGQCRPKLSLSNGMDFTLDLGPQNNYVEFVEDIDGKITFYKAGLAHGIKVLREDRVIPEERHFEERYMLDKADSLTEGQFEFELEFWEKACRLCEALIGERGVFDIDASRAVKCLSSFIVNLQALPKLRERAIALLSEWTKIYYSALKQKGYCVDRIRMGADYLALANLVLGCDHKEQGNLVLYQRGVTSIIDLQWDGDSRMLLAAQNAIHNAIVNLGDSETAAQRKIIACTNIKRSVEALFRTEPGVFVCLAEHVEKYKEVCRPANNLIFQPGHPRNGCTYVQHPLQKNVYFEVNSYHDSLRERKQNELLRILEALGAYSARVEVRHEQQEMTSFGQESLLSANGSYGVVNGSASRNISGERQTSMSSSQSATKDWTFNPPEKPYLPDDLVFYPTEETWQQLANSVLRGGLKRAVVDLEYKSEYGITEKYLSDVAASVKSLLPSFDMNLSKSFSSNLHRLTTTQWHYEVIFENETGERAGANDKVASQITSAPPSADANKVELLFAKRAKRYAQSEGHINAEQRADLEAFAQKYGIDEFRMEELIEEAFE